MFVRRENEDLPSPFVTVEFWMTMLSDWMMSHPSVFFSKLKVWLIARILMSVNTTSLEFATMLVQKGELFKLRSETDPP